MHMFQLYIDHNVKERISCVIEIILGVNIEIPSKIFLQWMEGQLSAHIPTNDLFIDSGASGSSPLEGNGPSPVAVSLPGQGYAQAAGAHHNSFTGKSHS